MLKPFDWTRRTHEPFLYAALVLALTAGFGYGALMVGALALGVIPGVWWGAVVQAHGHAQLFGWLGLFVLGMGLYFVPKLRGVSLQEARRTPFALTCIGGGIVLRGIAQPLSGFLSSGDAIVPLWQVLWLVSAVLELAGVLVILSILRRTLRMEKPLPVASPAYASEPFALIAFLSLFLAFLLNALGVWNAVAQNKTTVAPPFENLVITLMLYGVAVPMAIVFSTRTLPLFLRLATPPNQSLRVLGPVYASALFLVLFPSLPVIPGVLPAPWNRFVPVDDLFLTGLNVLWGIGSLALNLCILVFVWQIDLVRRRPPWVVNRAPTTRPDLDYLRKPTRANYPDAGEYGRFELLIYSAYGWLVLAVVLNLARGLGEFTGWISVSPDTARHALAVGFITLLIFGMAARMAPGFSQKKGIAYPRLVAVTFVLGNLAAFLRVVPTLFPSSEIALVLWGLSGIVAWAAIVVFAVNLVSTFCQTSR